MSYLLPCPFCGGRCEIKRLATRGFWKCIVCTKCDMKFAGNDYNKTDQELIELFNSRKTDVW